ncbi:MAG: ABC transporter permease subunit [Eubacteriales bacterium]|nr:ABC transporter permease subunit [Eubacteriales bacterium]
MQWELQAMAIPAMLFLLLFCYVPIFGNVIAFQDYKILKGIGGSEWVGFKHFQEFWQDETFWMALKNTLCMSGYKFLFTYFAPVLFAILLNELTYPRFKKLTQTASYLPHFLSYVIVASMAMILLGPSGVVNRELALHGMQRIGFLDDPKLFWSVSVGLDLWKETGWNAIIYLAAISGVNPELYEAATIDGATRVQRIVHITLPSISWTMLMLFILNFGSLLSGGPVGSNFDQSYMLGNGFNYETSYVLNHYVLDMGMSLMRFSFSTAINMFQSLVSLALLLTANTVVGKLTDSSLF